jgi:16S rRNA processing protein RimM
MIGRIGRPHGVRGELLVEVRTDDPDARFVVGAGLTGQLPGGERRVLVVEAVRPHSGRLLVRFAGVAGRDGADPLRGTLLLVDAGTLPVPEDPDEFYDHQLTGLAARLVDGTPAGTVTDVVHGPGGELLVITRADGAERLVPFVEAIVPSVDLRAGLLVLDPPPGLLDELPAPSADG